MIQISDRNGKSKWQDNNQFVKGIISAKFIPDTGFDKRIVKAEWELDAAPLKTVENDPAKYNTEILWSQQDTGTFTISVAITYEDESTENDSVDFIVNNPPA